MQFYSSAEVQSVYSTAPASWALTLKEGKNIYGKSNIAVSQLSQKNLKTKRECANWSIDA